MPRLLQVKNYKNVNYVRKNRYSLISAISREYFLFTVKPVIKIPGDETPPVYSEDEAADNEPVGDIAELTSRVSENAAVPREMSVQDPPSSARVRVYGSKKNKGVGKGCSRSSGPPPKKQAVSTVSIALDEDEDNNSSGKSSSDDEEECAVTQTITVGSTRGYTYYPGYLFDVPPKKLKTDTLCKKLMISEIKRSETQTQFYERGMVLMGHLKEFLRHMIMSGNLGETSTSQKKAADEHCYALHRDSDDEDQTESQK